MAATPQAEHQLGARHWMAYAVLCGTWSTTWMAIRVLVSEVPPFRAAALRFAMASVLLLGLAAVRRAPWARSARGGGGGGGAGGPVMASPLGGGVWGGQGVASS